MPDENVDYTILLQRLQAHNLPAFEQLYRHMRNRLYIYALSILKDEAAAQDIVQELFLTMWEGRQFEHIHTGLVPYLVKAVRNRSLDYLKKEQTRDKIRHELALLDSGQITSADKLTTLELRAELENAVSRLPPMPAKVFQLHYIEKLSYTEIADKLNISTSTVSNHMVKGLKLLRAYLKNN
ncbi:RNA polymerase sigma-70 factor, ECF subfamily [Filimonas lacunae]|uniref:RNA polymerase sigma-70 factor, ECF subfamily n=1 Tax=Filimonas lacunae TaxID=477680 RepID=A0A173MBK1_9BACT|nr:RNA polymerase sigma-70 factor [Filimonas lacunae]BAV04953.1 RNA polymerase ECF-type sigma factor [Filimonas lacunae]SIT33731.1 RNA polymerase sigma-70 factor, ECF subfamily [Filimonas lacunae]